MLCVAGRPWSGRRSRSSMGGASGDSPSVLGAICGLILLSSAERFGRRERAAMLWRSFAIQGPWNYRTLIGHGYAFALLPALRAIYRAIRSGSPTRWPATRRLFNSHPYLAPMALGAVARLEAEGEDPGRRRAIQDCGPRVARDDRGPVGLGRVAPGLPPLLPRSAHGRRHVVACRDRHSSWSTTSATSGSGSWSYRLGVAGGEAGRRADAAVGDATVQRGSRSWARSWSGSLVPLAVAGRHLPRSALPSAEAVDPVAWMAIAIVAAMLGARFGALFVGRSS